MIEKYVVSPLLTLALIILALSWTVTGYAQLNTGKVEGTVRDKDTGAPLAGAQVTIEGTRLGNVTNADGYYFILNIPPGNKSVTFTYTGYQKTTISNLLILAGQTLTVDGNLSGTVVELGGINHVGMGPDFADYLIQYMSEREKARTSLEGTKPVEGFAGDEDFPQVADALAKRGYSEQDISLMMGENFLRVFKEVLKK